MNFQDSKLQALVNKCVELLKESIRMEEELEFCDKHDEKLDAADNALVEYCLSLMPAKHAEPVRNSPLFAAKIIDKYVWPQV